MNITFIISIPFPYGLASTNRLVSIAHGLVKNGANVKVWCIGPTKYHTSNEAEKFKRKGTYKCVPFEYTSLVVKSPKNKIIRIFSLFIGYLSSFFKIYIHNKSQKNNFIIIYQSRLYMIFGYKLLSLLLSSKFILMVSEYPKIIRNPNKLTPIFLRFFSKIIYKPFDGILPITYSLRDYFEPLKRKKAKTTVVPMTVELDRFNPTPINRSIITVPYIAYCGKLSNLKDGIDILIKSFSKITNKYPKLKLVLIGSDKKKIIERLKTLSIKLNIENKVTFTGYLDRDTIIKYLKDATICALARPDSIQARGGFPTKLGEYLATGNPVAVTKVGEIPRYLKDKENAFLSQPGSVVSFASTLIEILDNPILARKVGEKGRLTAQECFDAVKQSKKIIDFFNNNF